MNSSNQKLGAKRPSPESVYAIEWWQEFNSRFGRAPIDIQFVEFADWTAAPAPKPVSETRGKA